MVTLMMIFRIIHILCGVFWVGFAITNFFYLQPAIRATGAEGQTVMQYLGQKTKLMPMVYLAATLTFISGLAMFMPLMPILHTGYGMVISIGALAGILAWIIALFIVRRIVNRMDAQGSAIQSQDGPPSDEQQQTMANLGVRLNRAGIITLIFLFIALVGMSVAQYVPF